MKRKWNVLSTFIAVAALLTLTVFVFTGCEESGNDGGDTVTASFADDFYDIAFDVDGDGDTSYTYDGETINDNVFPGGGRILTYDANADGEPDKVDGKYWRLVSRRFAMDDTDDDLSGLTDKVKFTADTVWFLEGSVFIGQNDSSIARSNSTVLEIEEGTTIKGIASSSNPGTLVIDRNGKIDAEGSATAPIVFTSSKPEGSREPGDWGGIVINGRARVQGNTATGEGDTGVYGGDDDADNSGTLKYVLVQFAGTLFTPENELNGIAFQGVGAGTTVDYIQVHQNADDGIEFFGGSVQVTHVVLTGNEDDSLDFDDGFNGSAQFVVIQQYPGGDYAIEGDGDAEDVFAAASPVLANFTIVGPTGSASEEATDGGPRFKENADPDFYNSLIVNYVNADPPIREATEAAPTIEYYGVALEAGSWDKSDAADWEAQVDSNGNVQVGAGEAALWEGTDHIVEELLTSGNYAFNAQPKRVDAGTAQTLPATDTHGNAITATTYLGAVDPDGTDWTEGWLQTPAN